MPRVGWPNPRRLVLRELHRYNSRDKAVSRRSSSTFPLTSSIGYARLHLEYWQVLRDDRNQPPKPECLCGSATYSFGLFRAIPKTAGWKPRATERSTAFASRTFKASISRWVKKRLEFRTTVCPSRRPEHCYVQSEIVNLQSARPAGLSPAVSVAPAPEARQENPDSRFQMRHHQTQFCAKQSQQVIENKR